jgi:5-formyltetrahydrofolate cyclo-ligase
VELDPDAVAIFRQQAKAMMRKRARALRASLPKAAIAARSAALCERLLELPALRAAKSVALFDPIVAKNEVDLRDVDRNLRARGVEVYYPSIDPEDRVMVFRRVDDPDAMQERGLGFRDPGPGAPEAEALDVVVVPAIAVDGRGHRIGYGAGFYDRALPRYAPPALKVAVAFDFQLAAEVPNGDADVPVDWVVTDGKVLEIPREP